MSFKVRKIFLIAFYLTLHVSDSAACRPDLSAGASQVSTSASPSSPEIGIPLTFEMIAALNVAVGQSVARFNSRRNAAIFGNPNNDLAEQQGQEHEDEENDEDAIGR